MRFITYLGCSVAVVCLATYTAVAAEYGWEAENFATRDGAGPAVFDVPLTTTDGSGVEIKIDEAYSDQFVGSENASALTGLATYGVNLPAAGNWYFWGRIIGPPGADNSFFWSVDGAADVAGAGMNIWDFNELAAGSINFPLGNPPPAGAIYDWMWFRVSSRAGPFEGRGDTTIPINLTAGFHTFNLAVREDGAYADVFFATTDSALDANVTAPTAVEPEGKLATTWANMKQRI